MSDLPDGWEWATLGELCEAQPGFASGKHNRSGDGVLHLRPMNITRNGAIDVSDARYVRDSSERRVMSGDVLFNNTNSPELVGKTALFNDPDPVGFSNHMTRIRPVEGVFSNFLACQLHFLWRTGYFKSVMSNHVNQASVSTKILLRTSVLLAPLAEQRRIVSALEDHLSRLDAGVAGVDAVASKMDRFRDRVLAAAADGSLLGQTDECASPPEPAGVVDGTLPKVPFDWTWRRLGEVADVVGGITKDGKKQSDPALPEVPYLRVANVQRGSLNLNDVASIRADPEKIEKLTLRPGDVLLNEGGDRDKLGRGWVWEGQLAQCIHQNHVFRARIHDGILHPKLLSWHANGFGKNWFFANGKQSVNLASVSLSKVKLLPVPVPPPEQQQELVRTAESYLTMFDEAERLIEQARIRAEQLRRSLLREAFAGRLVEQEPSDEPASVLLERIRAERASVPKAKRTRKPRAAKTRSAQAQPAEPAEADAESEGTAPAAPSPEIASDRPLPPPVGNGTQELLDLDL
ncbi:type I restriction enzyme S subunit [Halopolyspora algeriensis]|uniref:Type I restriction enzyme S subunit n=1 Tax=Halopolyspora algeriensis TaxID=1500506 RepID=A0A368VV58_9ACTN|nr:restriction endonuclease subunit S [Halopolyspora algeriensis]RCW43323.1 type I restriction enzyme S subunit [Halopolyspora algeriensis]TQM56380.1 type I restriction enzyme S subunit [Halopolyspora algeriensis]